MTRLCATILCVTFLIVKLQDSESKGQDGSMSALHNKLFGKWKSEEILYPVRDGNESVTVDIKLDITHIHSVDEHSGTVTTNGLLSMRWEDSKLKWTPEDFGGINSIKVSQKLLWVPDIIVSNGGTFKDMERSGDALVTVVSNGALEWIPPVTFHSICPMNHTKYYPNHEHICTLRLMSMTFTDKQLKLRLDPSHNTTEALEIFDQADNPKWELVRVVTETSVLTYVCCPTVGVPYVDYRLHLRRKSHYFTHLLTVPSVAIALLTIVAFWTESANLKISIAALSAFATIHMQFFLHWYMPPGVGSSAIIVRFCISTFLLNTVTILMTVAMSRMDTVPEAMQTWFNKCFWVSICQKPFCLAQQNQRNPTEGNGRWSSAVTTLHRLVSCALSIIYIAILASYI